VKRLFEMVAPVSFVDFDIYDRALHGEVAFQGYVRFKTCEGAELACTYFKSECVKQVKPADLGTLDAAVSRVHKECVTGRRYGDTMGICLVVLEGLFDLL
jgi:hypothetical protein